MRRQVLIAWIGLGLIFLCLLMPALAVAGEPPIPREALRYRGELTRNARLVWGLDAPVATFAGQIHQESAWRAEARSPVGAEGMAQFMPGTARWIAGAYPATLGGAEVYNPAWAMRALVTYDLWLWERIPLGDGCHRMWATLRGYNGGLGHWLAEYRLAPAPTQPAVDAQCGKARRAAAHCPENLAYPRRILLSLAPRYERAGFGPGSCS